MKRIIPFLLLAFVFVGCKDDGPTVPTVDPQFAKPDCQIDPSHPSCEDGGDGDGELYTATDLETRRGRVDPSWAWDVTDDLGGQTVTVAGGSRVGNQYQQPMTWTVTGTDVVDGPNPLPADFPDHQDVFAFGISDDGSYIVGRAQGNTDSDYTTWELYGAVRWTGGSSQFSSQLLDPFGEHTKAVASDVNNSGQAVGKSWGGGTPLVATVWDGESGTPTSLVSPWGRPGAARGINNQGDVVGASKDDGAKWRAILWLSGGGYCDLDPQGFGSVAEDITDVGADGTVLVAGVTGLPDNAQPAVWSIEVTETPCVLDFWTMGSPPQATAYAVRRTVEGWEAVGYDDYGEGQRAFVWRFDGSGITEIQLAKAGRALGINSSGQIAGNAEAKKKEDHAMLWTPN